MDSEIKEPEVDVHEAAIRAAVAELGDMPAEVVAWRRAQFESAVKAAAMTWSCALHPIARRREHPTSGSCSRWRSQD